MEEEVEGTLCYYTGMYELSPQELKIAKIMEAVPLELRRWATLTGPLVKAMEQTGVDPISMKSILRIYQYLGVNEGVRDTT